MATLFQHVQSWASCVASAADLFVERFGRTNLDERMLWHLGVFYLFLVLAGLVTHVILFLRFQARPLAWEQRVAAFENTPWQPREAVRILLVLMALYFGVSFLKKAVSAPHDEPAAMIVLQTALFHITGIVFVAYSVKRQRLTWRDAFGISADGFVADVRRGIVLYLAMMPIVVFYSLLYHWFLRYVGYRVAPQDVIVMFVSDESAWSRAYAFLLAVIIAPFFEELIFRGIALPLLGRYRGTIWAVLVLSAAFAMIHFHIPSLVPLFLVGLALSIGYVYSRSLTVSIVTHGLFNLVNLTVLALLRGGS